MKERIQEQINHELKQASRMDRTIVIISIIITFIMFIIALTFAYNSVGFNISAFSTGSSISRSLSTYSTVIMFVSLVAIIIINWVSVRALLKNKAQRSKLTDGLMKLYKEEGVDQYYDGSIFKSHETRYNNLAIILTTVGAVSVILPLAIFVHQIVTKL